MKKTYITNMPNHIGAFLKASRCFASLGINITRVSYNKAIDSHTLFIDAEGTPEQLQKADEELYKIGYLQNYPYNNIVLAEFRLKDVPGSVTDILALISEFNFNISYISSQENGTGYQMFKMGLSVDDKEKFAQFINSAQKLCRVRIIDYDQAEKIYDNSVFYNAFVSALAQTIGLSEEYRNDLLVNCNLAMQILDEDGLSPYKTFDSIRRITDMLAKSRHDAFDPRITYHNIGENTQIILIEPPCGSNTAIIRSCGETLFIDSGYALYKEEMFNLFKSLLPDFDSMKKSVYITHADVDHCGLLPYFDEVITNAKSAQCLRLEYENAGGYREQNPRHLPYINICKIITSYQPVNPAKVKVICGNLDEAAKPLTLIGQLDVGELHFDIYEGMGGHLPGETILIDYKNHLAFTGDIFINIKGCTPKQAEYNIYAPVLMTSVDTDPKLCALERKLFFELLGKGKWLLFGAHGYKKEYEAE